jgi:hypothetical protein
MARPIAIVWPRKSGPKLHVHVRRTLRRALSRLDLTTHPSPQILRPCRCFLNPVFFFPLRPTGDEEASQRGSRHCGGGRRHSDRHQEPSERARRTGTRVRGVIARRCGAGEVRRDGGRWRRGGSTPKKGAAQRPASRRPPRQKIGRDDCDKGDQ